MALSSALVVVASLMRAARLRSRLVWVAVRFCMVSSLGTYWGASPLLYLKCIPLPAGRQIRHHTPNPYPTHPAGTDHTNAHQSITQHQPTEQQTATSAPSSTTPATYPPPAPPYPPTP